MFKLATTVTGAAVLQRGRARESAEIYGEKVPYLVSPLASTGPRS